MNTRRKESRIVAHPKRLPAVKDAFNLHLTPLSLIFWSPFPHRSFQRTVSSQSNDTGGSSIIRRTDKSVQVS